MLRGRTEVLVVSNEPFHQLHVGRIIDFFGEEPDRWHVPDQGERGRRPPRGVW